MQESDEIEFFDFFTNFQIKKSIGVGTFGKIYKVRGPNRSYAMKKVKFTN